MTYHTPLCIRGILNGFELAFWANLFAILLILAMQLQ
jgi:hypothetical protein